MRRRIPRGLHRREADRGGALSPSASTLATGRLALYALPALPLAVIGIPVYVHLPAYYAGELGLGLAAVGTVLLLARLWDVLTDPLVGFLSDHAHPRFGRRRTWMAIGCLPTLAAVWLLFRPPEGAGPGYLLVTSILLYAGWTLIILPYQSWGAELTDDYHQRSRVAAFREAAILLGTLLAAGLPALFGITGAGAILALLSLLVVLALPATLAAAFVAFPDPLPPERPPLRLLEGVTLVLCNAPFRRLLAAYLANGIANGLPATLFTLFVTQVLAAPAATGPLLLVYFLAGVAATPLWLRLSYRFGKHRTWAASMLFVCLVFQVVPLLGPGDIWLFGIVCVLSGLGLGADLVLPTAMQADVVDVDRLATGARRTGVYFALWGMATKLALALAVGIGFPLLDLVGFDASGGNDRGSLVALALLYAGLPVVLKLIAVRLVWNFPLDEAAQAALRRRIDGGQTPL